LYELARLPQRLQASLNILTMQTSVSFEQYCICMHNYVMFLLPPNYSKLRPHNHIIT